MVYCKMAGLQSEIYKTIMSQEDMHYILTQRQPCTCGSETTRGTCCYSVSKCVSCKIMAGCLKSKHSSVQISAHVRTLLNWHVRKLVLKVANWITIF